MKIEKMQYSMIGKYIRKRREALKISLNEFSFENEIEPAILSRVETGKQDIKLNILIKIARGFGKTPSEFLLEFEQAKE